MKMSITTGSPRTEGIRTVDGRIRQQIVVEEAEHEMTIRASTRELQEVLTRLQGMPGVPAMSSEGAPVSDEVSRMMSVNASQWDDYRQRTTAAARRAFAVEVDTDEVDTDEVDPGFIPFMYDTMKPQLMTMDAMAIDKIARGDWGSTWRAAARYYINEAAMEVKRLAAQKSQPAPEPAKIMDPNFPRDIDVS